MARKNEITKLQREFVKVIADDIISTGGKPNVVQAAIKAGYAEDGAKAAGYANMKNIKVLELLYAEIANRAATDYEGSKKKLLEKLTEEWVIRGLRDLAVNAKQASVKVQALTQLGKWHKLGMWTERVENISPSEDKEKLLAHIDELNRKLGVVPVRGATGVLPKSGSSETAQREESDRRSGTDESAERFPLRHIRDKAVQRGERVRQKLYSGDGFGDADDGGTSSTTGGEDGGTSRVCEGDVAVSN